MTRCSGRPRPRKQLPIPPANRPVLSVAEAAALLGIGQTTVRDLVRARKIQHTRLGRRIVFKREWIMGVLEGTAPPT